MDVLDDYLDYRNEMIVRHPDEPEPETLIITEYQGKLSWPVSDTFLDDRRVEAQELVGFKFGYHDLRRTWARQAYYNGADINDIRIILGHKDIATTLMYIGVDIDRSRNVIRLVNQVRRTGLEQSH